MKRTKGWQKRLIAYLDATHRKPMRPGKHDCALFAAGAVEAMTGVDLARGWRGYRTFNEGRKFLEKAGHASIADMIAAHLAEIDPDHALPGDVMIVDGVDGADATGILQGDFIYTAGPRGRVLVRREDALRAFRVER